MPYTFIAINFKTSRILSADLNHHGHFELGFVFVIFLRELYPNTMDIIGLQFCWLQYNRCGPGSSFGIATDCGFEGPGSNADGDEIFRPSRPALWPNQPAV